MPLNKPFEELWDEIAENEGLADDYDSGEESSEIPSTDNSFCPTGKGGGVNPSCSPGAASAGRVSLTTRIVSERHVPPPPGQAYRPNVHAVDRIHGTTVAARVGVPGNQVPPPPPIGKLPNLTARERAVEEKFINRYERDPDGVARIFRKFLVSKTKPGEAVTFGTDDAKVLADEWGGHDLAERSQNRATLNLTLHQTANAIAKRAFLQHLDTLKPGDEVLVTVGGCGCHVADTPIMMADSSLKLVQDIEVGDELMGPDSQPRKVLRLIRGVGRLYDVIPTKGKAFRVNEDHVLSVISDRWSGLRGIKSRGNITIKELLRASKAFRTGCLLHRVGVDFEYQPVALDPYYLGIWLGDGTHSLANVTTADEEIAAYVRNFASRFTGVEVDVREKDTVREDGGPNRAKDYRIVLINKHQGKGAGNPVVNLLKQLGVFKNKHIPSEYLKNDRDTRLRLLAGLLDTDGSLGSNGYFEYLTKHEMLAYDVAYLARSLGLAAYVKARWVKTKFIQEERCYWRVIISGDIAEIPTLLPRKKANTRRINKDVLRVGFKVEEAGEGAYYGFTLEGDGLYLLDDFTVTHNSGKGYCLKNVPESLAMKKRSKVVWDSAGDQNATENPWVQYEAETRGLKVNYVFVHADPYSQWGDPKKGVVKRAGDPADGRMVDAKVFADSYAIGARNHQAFYERNKDNPSASFAFLDNTGTPKLIDGIPPSALRIDPKHLARHAENYILSGDHPAHIRRASLIGRRVWGES